MKLKILLLLITFQSYSQVSFGVGIIDKSRKINNELLERFKNTETIFLLSDIYEKETYEKILKDSWDVTPYKIVDLESFNLENYLSSKYSVAQLTGFKRTIRRESGSTKTSVFTYVDLRIYDSEAIFKKLDNLSPKKRKKKKQDIITLNSYSIARFYTFPKDDFVRTILSSDTDIIFNSLFTDDVFFNYKPGFLKNYFQKINNLIKNGEVYWMYEDDYLPELKKLTKNKLYIPKYMTVFYNGWTGQESEEKDENINDIFKKYEYKYEIISDEEISNKILNNEEFYYLRYVRTNAERFLQVVNSKTGEITYRNYITGLSFQIKEKHIKDLNKKIKKAFKK